MSDLTDSFVNLKLVLDETVKFPSIYLFKFIVPIVSLDEILIIMQGMEIDQKPSKSGKYISVSGKKNMISSQEIISIYQSASVIKGIISL